MKKVSLETQYVGLKLKNPIIISSSGLTNQVLKIKRLEGCGAGAVVLKSLFEEQILLKVADELSHTDSNYPEADDFLRTFIKSDQINNYLQLIKESKKECTIPIIASINCYNLDEWILFAKHIEEAGADALEINIMYLNTDKEFNFGVLEYLTIDILAALKKNISIPIIMKLGRTQSSLVALIRQLKHNNANAVVLFNRPYQPDIDIDNIQFRQGPLYSNSFQFNDTLRWIAIIAGLVPQLDLSASGGVFTPEDIIKIILAGANTVQLCSVIYEQGPEIIASMIAYMNDWMLNHNFDSIDQFKGLLKFDSDNENIYERLQFMRYYSNLNDFPPV